MDKVEIRDFVRSTGGGVPFCQFLIDAVVDALIDTISGTGTKTGYGTDMYRVVQNRTQISPELDPMSDMMVSGTGTKTGYQRVD